MAKTFDFPIFYKAPWSVPFKKDRKMSNSCLSRAHRQFYLWKATTAFAFNTDSFNWIFSHWGSDQRNLPSLSTFPACCKTSQTQATCSWVKPNEGIDSSFSSPFIVKFCTELFWLPNKNSWLFTLISLQLFSKWLIKRSFIITLCMHTQFVLLRFLIMEFNDVRPL